MKTTANYGFNKPEGTDVVNISDFNSNADAIDVELAKRAMKADIPIKTSQLNNDSGFITLGETPVQSINGKVGNITLAAGDIGAEPAITKNTAFNQNFETNTSNIKMNGIALVGITNNVARADHVHPSDNAKVNQSDFNTHLADYVRQPGYAVDTGTANHLVVTLNPVPTSYADGMGVVVKVKVAGTAATDINVNALGVKNVFDALGNQVTNFRANTTYSLKYESVSGNFIVQGKGGGGNLIAAHLLTGDTATGDSGPIIGTMINKVGSETTIIPSGSDQIIPQGYYGGLAGDGVVKAIKLIAGETLFAAADPGSFSHYFATTTWTKLKEIQILNVGGTIRVRFDLKSFNPGYTTYGQIYANGVSVGTLRTTTSTTAVTYTEDFTVSAGDKIQFWGQTLDKSYNAVENSFLKIYTTMLYADNTVLQT